MHYKITVLFVPTDEINYVQDVIEQIPGAIGVYQRAKQFNLYISVELRGYKTPFIYIDIEKGPDRPIDIGFQFRSV
jgi:hypothetical protein